MQKLTRYLLRSGVFVAFKSFELVVVFVLVVFVMAGFVKLPRYWISV